VILAGPIKPLIPHELDALRQYLAKGGRLLAMIDPGFDPGLAPLLDDYRLKLDDDMVVDQEEVAFLGARLGVDPLLEDFPPHPITKGFKQRIILSRARSITIAPKEGFRGDGSTGRQTHESAWGETGWKEMLAPGASPSSSEDKAGPR